MYGQDKHLLQLIPVSKGMTQKEDILGGIREFNNINECRRFLKDELVAGLQKKGYLAASVDSIFENENKTIAWVYSGQKYGWGELIVDSIALEAVKQKPALAEISKGSLLDPEKLVVYKENLLQYFENNGYPFASVKLDSSYFLGDKLNASLKVVVGPLYHIDSISVEGNLRIKKVFLEKYLDSPSGSIYQGDKLDKISKKISQLGFLRESRPWDLTLLGTGSKLNLYLESKRSSQINLLAGLMPSNTQLGGKLLLTGEADMQLKNAFGGGENMLLNWQQLQVQSPRLLIGFQKPYLFKSNAGIDFQFNLFKKDSTFLTLNTRLGIQYDISTNKTVKVFFQQFSSSLLDVDTNRVKFTKKLPAYVDIGTGNIGVDLIINNTDDRFNPRSGILWSTRITGGVRKIKKNNAIIELKQDAQGKPFNYATLYDTVKASSAQLRFNFNIEGYQKIGRQSTVKLAIQGGYLQSERLYTNELFQVGGIKTLRGFDEESIFASEFLIATLEYRYLIGPSSYLFSFVDAAHAGRKNYQLNYTGRYLGAGLGLSFETKSGIFKLAYAVGKQPNSTLNFREAKIHFGFVSLF
jgi:outer membrane protein assembly factor BamA